MLESITLTHWRSHANSRVRLSRGTNILLGPMGSGKSSVMDALCFALYGTYPKLGRRDAKVDDVGNFRHPGQSVLVEVEWTQEAGGSGGASSGAGGEASSAVRFKVRRDLSASDAWLYRDGRLVQSAPKRVSEEVERALGIPYELFARAVYSEQNRLDYWLSLGPGQRKEELDHLLGLDRYETARANATTRYNALRERAALIEQQSAPEALEAARKELAEAQGRQAEAERRGAEGAARLGAMANPLAEAEALYRALEAEQKRRQALSEQKKGLEGSILTLERSISQAPQGLTLERAREERKALGEARAGIEASLAQVRARQGTASAALSQARTRLKMEEEKALKLAKLREQRQGVGEGKTLDELKARAEAARAGVQAQVALRATLHSGLEDVKKVLPALEVSHTGHDGRAACPVCRQGLDEQRREALRAEFGRRRQKLEGELRAADSTLVRLRAEAEGAGRAEALAAGLDAQMGALAPAPERTAWLEEERAAREGSERLAAEEKTLSARLAEAQKAEAAAALVAQRMEQAAAWAAQLEKARAEAAGLEAELAKTADSGGRWEAARLERERLMREKATLEEAARAAGQLSEGARRLSQAAAARVAELEKRRAEAAAARAEMDGLGTFRNVVVQTQTQMRALLIEELNATLARLWPLLYPYGDWTGVRLVATPKDYQVEIKQGEWKGLEAHASGGERACIGLCLRAALSLLLTPSLGWLILDEPTHNLDAEAVGRLGRALAESMPLIIPQVLVITHDQELVESAPGRVIRFERDKARGEDTRVQVDE